MGFSIALDDLGAGYSSLRLWSELRPDYVKIDRHFIDGIHQDPLKREFVGSILQIAGLTRPGDRRRHRTAGRAGGAD
jgi:EAL domain-containing protein (putative c-di-GMP-specific phosphodiesterase class I)